MVKSSTVGRIARFALLPQFSQSGACVQPIETVAPELACRLLGSVAFLAMRIASLSAGRFHRRATDPRTCLVQRTGSDFVT